MGLINCILQVRCDTCGARLSFASDMREWTAYDVAELAGWQHLHAYDTPQFAWYCPRCRSDARSKASQRQRLYMVMCHLLGTWPGSPVATEALLDQAQALSKHLVLKVRRWSSGKVIHLTAGSVAKVRRLAKENVFERSDCYV